MNPAASAPPSPRRRIAALRSSAGAFDLPSILVGVVVVGILTAGVLAAIFGVIPWAQDRSAKQDLAAINTAQGVTYAKDGQAYKDLAGLEGARLVSGLKPDKAEVTVLEEGKSFAAAVTSGSGTKWCITNADTEPWECTGTPPGTAVPADWSGAFCEPELKSMVDSALGLYLDPRVLEYLKAQQEMAYDEAAAAGWVETHMSGGPSDEIVPMDPELAATGGDMFQVLLGALLGGIANLPAENVDDWPAMHAKAVEAYNAAGASFCETYTGPVAEPEEHPSRAEAFEDQRQALTGSHEPVVLGYTFAFGGTDTWDISVSGTEGLAGFQSSSQDFEMVDGVPYWTTVLTPGASGWGESAGTANVTLGVTRNDDKQKVREETLTRQLKANSNVLAFTRDPDEYQGGGDTPGYGDTWDHQVRHKGSLSRSLSYAVTQLAPSEGSEISVDRAEILDVTDGMNARVSQDEWASSSYSGSISGRFSFYTADGEALNEGTITLRQEAFDPQTFARASHVFSYSVIKTALTGGPVVSAAKVSRTDDSYSRYNVMTFDVEDGYDRIDYSYDVVYAGETVSAGPSGGGSATFWATPDVWAVVYVTVQDLFSLGGYPYASVSILLLDENHGDEYPKEFQLKATYLPTGESTIITGMLP